MCTASSRSILARVLLLAPVAHGDERAGSDVDLSVLMPALASRRKGAGVSRLGLPRDVPVPVDIVVVDLSPGQA